MMNQIKRLVKPVFSDAICLHFPISRKQRAIRKAVSIRGWTGIPKLSLLFDLVQKTRNLDCDILEIGSAWGRSTILLALASNKKTIWSIDPHTGGLEYIQKGQDQGSYEEFTMNLEKHGVRERVYVLKNTTQEVLQKRLLPDGVKFSFVFIDGLHTPSGVQTDFLLSFPRLIYGGIMVFDDYYEKSVKDYAKLIDMLTSTEGMQLVMEPSSRLVWFVKSRPSQEK